MSYESYKNQAEYAVQRLVDKQVVDDLLGYGTEKDDDFLTTARECETFGDLGDALGVTALSAYQRFCRVKRNAAKKGAQPGLSPGLIVRASASSVAASHWTSRATSPSSGSALTSTRRSRRRLCGRRSKTTSSPCGG